MYSVRGWSSTHVGAISGVSSNDKMSVSSSLSSQRNCEEEEVDGSEEKDIAAPLPANNKQLNKSGGKGTSAKDKRRMREKRRSTGVANLSGHEADEVTTRNTSYNEMPGVTDSREEPEKISNQSDLHHHSTSHETSTSVNNELSSVCAASANSGEQSQSGSHAENVKQNQPSTTHSNGSMTHHKTPNDNITATAVSTERLRVEDNRDEVFTFESESAKAAVSCSNPHLSPPPPPPHSSSDFARNFCPRPFEPFEPKRGILKPASSRPVISPKPHSSSSSRTLPVVGQRSNEEVQLTSRIKELETLLESEKKEKALLEKLLNSRDSRIRDLEVQVATLNEDLDLADEDYIRLEEENRAMARALSQFNLE